MIKRRLGDSFHSQLSDNLEVKAIEVARKGGRGDGRRRPRGEHKERGERKPREPREKKEGAEKVEEETAQQGKPAETEQAAPKREGRRRGGREGQEWSI